MRVGSVVTVAGKGQVEGGVVTVAETRRSRPFDQAVAPDSHAFSLENPNPASYSGRISPSMNSSKPLTFYGVLARVLVAPNETQLRRTSWIVAQVIYL